MLYHCVVYSHLRIFLLNTFNVQAGCLCKSERCYVCKHFKRNKLFYTFDDIILCNYPRLLLSSLSLLRDKPLNGIFCWNIIECLQLFIPLFINEHSSLFQSLSFQLTALMFSTKHLVSLSLFESEEVLRLAS